MTERIAETKEAFLRPRLFLVAPRAADAAVELKFLNRPEQYGNLQLVPAHLPRRRCREPFLKRLIDRAHDQLRAQLLRTPISKFNQLRKFMPRFHVEKWHRNLGRPERFLGQTQDADGIFAAGKQNRRPLKFRRHLAQHMDGFRLEIRQMIQVITAHFVSTAFPPQAACSPHSRFSSALAGSK